MNFNYWKNEIADMPALVDGEWVDLETGIPFKTKPVKTEKPKIDPSHPDAKLKLAELRTKVEGLARRAQITLDNYSVEFPITAQFVADASETLAGKHTKAHLLNLITVSKDASREQNAIKSSIK